MERGKLFTRLALGLGMIMALGAQTCTLGPDDGVYGVPEGPYLRSCDDPRVVYGNTLVADCPDSRGRFQEASLRLPCYGDIANENGRLVCQRDDDGDVGGGYPPDGSYQRSCLDERVVRGDRLVAECRDRRGRLVETSLRLPCRGDIANDDGRLVCVRDGGGFVEAPRGPYRRSCVNVEVVRGDLLTADCRDATGRLVRASLRLPCYGVISNEYGRLVCRG